MSGRPTIERDVAPGEEGERLDRLVARWLDEPRSRSQRRLEGGEVAVDGAAAAKGRRVRAGERVVVAPPPSTPAGPPPPPVPIRHEDEHLVVVAKPPGLVVHRGAGVHEGTLVEALAAMGVPLAPTGDDRPGIVHRLDRGTSGLLVVAKTEACLRALQRLLADRTVRRSYVAVCEGVPEPAKATIDAAIGRDGRARTRFAVTADGRRAVTHYDVAERLGRAALVTARLETGRTHQIRVHLAAIGHPLVGDTLYGASAQLAHRLGLDRPALHAGRLAFDHPLTGGRVDVREPAPDDVTEALRRLRGQGG